MASGSGPWLTGSADESIGAMLARLRIAQGKSQLRLAELLCAASGLETVTRHEISRWEREERIPTATWLRWLAVVLNEPLGELERAAANARGRRAVGTSIEPPGGRPARARRTMMVHGMARAADRPKDVRHPGRPAPEELLAMPARAADLADPAALRARIGELRRMDDLISGQELAQVVRGELGTAMSAAARFAVLGGVEPVTAHERGDPAEPGEPPVWGERLSRAARERLGLVAQLAQLAGWVDADAGTPLATLAVHHTGLRAAVAAGDLPLAGHLAGCVAQLTAEAGDPHAALRLARNAATRAAPTASATTRALQWQRIAFAAAGAGERRACEEALVAAEQSFGRRDPQRDPAFLYWFDEAHLTAIAGRCYSALGRPRLARPLLVAALDSGSLRFRAWAITAAALARSHAEAGDLDAAGPLAEEALVTCVRAGSVRAVRQVRAVEPHLRAAARPRPGAVRPADSRLPHPALRSYTERAAALRPYLPVAARRPQRTAGPGRAPTARSG